MTGTILRIMERRSFNDYQDLKSNRTIEIPIMRHIDVSQYGHAALLIRTHSLNIQGDGAFVFSVRSDLPSVEDPQMDFVSDEILAVAFNSQSSTGPHLTVASLDATKMGAMIAIGLRVAEGGSTTQLDATFSVELHLRDN